jgi:hypothetical protein
MNHELNFDADTWDRLCLARLHYNEGTDKRTWWHALRMYANYKGGNQHLETKVARACDAWLLAHPSWRGRYVHS